MVASAKTNSSACTTNRFNSRKAIETAQFGQNVNSLIVRPSTNRFNSRKAIETLCLGRRPFFVIPNTGYHHGLERRLFNVATSRAKEHTIIIADKSVFEHKEIDQDVLSYLRRLVGERVDLRGSVIKVGPDDADELLGDAVKGAMLPSKNSNNAHRMASSSASVVADFWQNAVMNVLLPDQREEVLDTGAQSLAELDMAALISVWPWVQMTSRSSQT